MVNSNEIEERIDLLEGAVEGLQEDIKHDPKYIDWESTACGLAEENRQLEEKITVILNGHKRLASQLERLRARENHRSSSMDEVQVNLMRIRYEMKKLSNAVGVLEIKASKPITMEDLIDEEC